AVGVDREIVGVDDRGHGKGQIHDFAHVAIGKIAAAGIKEGQALKIQVGIVGNVRDRSGCLDFGWIAESVGTSSINDGADGKLRGEVCGGADKRLVVAAADNGAATVI